MLKDLLLKNRSYRGYDETRAVTREELVDLVEHARLTPSSVNKQALKYYLACEREKTNQIQPLTAWAKALKKEVPYEGHCPRAFIVICQDTAISTALEAYQKDVGIVAQTMLLRAAELGLGGCMICSFQKNALHEVLKLSENLVPLLVVAIGKPDETIVLEDVNVQGDTTYYRDAQDVHHVPKRTTRELIINGE